MSDSEKLAEGTLISHLLELRTRIVRAFLVVIVLFVPCAFFADELYELLAKPIMESLPAGSSMLATEVMSTFTVPLKVAFVAALFLGMPYVLYQTWAFVAPGLYRHEKRFAIPLLVSSIVLFYAGFMFAYEFVFPLMFKFFASTGPEGVQFAPDINKYLSFAITMFFAFGLAFEVPVAVVLLAATGLVSVEKLRSNRGYVVLGIFILAAFLTPPDGLSQPAMALPMWALYEAGIVFAAIVQKSRREREALQSKENHT